MARPNKEVPTGYFVIDRSKTYCNCIGFGGERPADTCYRCGGIVLKPKPEKAKERA